ncbi:MAG TPA: C4-type zinc ribbon domain-containing protein [Vicinamibacteria bacterium]|nr:C4-type zinc ribbon domain-containing protein [Vicinamibacteria bacterium]
MIPELENLVRLQALDDEMRALETRLAAIPKEIAALENEIATEKRNLEEAETALGETQKTQRASERDLSLAEEKHGKYKDQLMNVKSNEEYKAMQKQIDVAKQHISDIEDAILAGLDQIEALEARRRARDQELKKGLVEITAMEKELEDERARLQKELDSRKSSREAILPSISSELLGEYQTIARSRGGVAVAEASDEHCQVCMVRLRPQVFHELKLGDRVHHCENCRRILFYRETEPTAAT